MKFEKYQKKKWAHYNTSSTSFCFRKPPDSLNVNNLRKNSVITELINCTIFCLL